MRFLQAASLRRQKAREGLALQVARTCCREASRGCCGEGVGGRQPAAGLGEEKGGGSCALLQRAPAKQPACANVKGAGSRALLLRAQLSRAKMCFLRASVADTKLGLTPPACRCSSAAWPPSCPHRRPWRCAPGGCGGDRAGVACREAAFPNGQPGTSPWPAHAVPSYPREFTGSPSCAVEPGVAA